MRIERMSFEGALEQAVRLETLRRHGCDPFRGEVECGKLSTWLAHVQIHLRSSRLSVYRMFGRKPDSALPENALMNLLHQRRWQEKPR
jgi:hypothetical protein